MNRKNLTFLHGMSHDQIREAAPAAFALSPAAKCSPGYQFVPTVSIIEMMEANNWKVISACQQKSRNPINAEHTKHKLIFRPMGVDVQALELGGLLPTIMLVNSHNWASRIEVLNAMLRLLCSNGLIGVGSQFETFSVRHDNVLTDMQTVMASFQANATKFLELAEQWSKIILELPEIWEFYRAAVLIRYPDTEMQTPDFRAIRSGDMANNLWTVFNRVQEWLLKGGYKTNRRKAREIVNISEHNRINRELFLLAEDFSNRLN